MRTASLDQVARDLVGDEETRQSIIDGLRMRLTFLGLENEPERYQATLRALQVMAHLRDYLGRVTHRG